MSFKFPESSPPSTPGKSHSPFSHMSTTPAGPPPPSSSTVEVSRRGTKSRTNFGESTFSQSGFGGNESFFSSIASETPPLLNTNKPAVSGSFGGFGGFGDRAGGFRAVNGGNNLKVRNRRPHGLSQMTSASEDWEDEDESEAEENEDQDAEGEEEEEEEEEEEDEGEDDDDEEEENEEDYTDEEEDDDDNGGLLDATEQSVSKKNPFSGSIFNGFGQATAPVPKRIYSNPNNAKRAKLDEQWATSSPQGPTDTIGPRRKKSKIPAVARDLASRSKNAAVTEPGEVILQTDSHICALLDKLQENEADDSKALSLLSEATAAITDFWSAACEKQRQQFGHFRPSGQFGPGENATGLEYATVVASLLLQLHHPRPRDFKRASRATTSYFNQALVTSSPSPRAYATIPQVLTDWLNVNHLGSVQEIESLQHTAPNPTASRHFWEIIQAGVLRGRFSEIAAILRSADFNHAHSALEDGFSQTGYRGMQLQTVHKSVNKVIQLLESSPLNENDWDIVGSDWEAYRKLVLAAQVELQELAEGDMGPLQTGGSRFDAPQFGVSTNNFASTQTGFSFAHSSRMAESRIPWSIYQGISHVYGVILGKSSTIMSVAQDWIEATIGLTVWWSGQDASNLGEFGNKDEPLSATDRRDEYLRRLNDCFGEVADGPDSKSQPNPLDKLDVAVACVFEGNVVGVVSLLKTWSLCVAAAVAEIAHEGGWLQTSGTKLANLFNQSDLMVLSYGQNDDSTQDQINKDEVLDAYAHNLGQRKEFGQNGAVRKGWELALEVYSRMEDNKKTRERVSTLLCQIPVDTVKQVDQVITLCIDLGFEEEGRKIAANFGERIIANGRKRADCDYGLAMVCFARARSIRKVKEIANSLIAYSLQQSRAWPPDEHLGGQLRSLVQTPKVCLTSIAAVDSEAAQIVQFYASGYATLRRFYGLRDELVLSKGDTKPQLRPLARRRAAAEALVAVIRSSADSIYGGLYDPERDSAVLVDNLLALLGEAVMFVNEKPSILSIEQQSNILAAIEDLETVTPRVFAVAKEFFYECLNEYIYETTGENPKPIPSPPTSSRDLKKSTSGLTASSSFSMIDSPMADSSMTQATNNTISSSGVLVHKPDTAREYAKPIQRGWDWRMRLAESSSTTNEADAAEGSSADDEIKPDQKLLRVLRIRLAQSMTWQ